MSSAEVSITNLIHTYAERMDLGDYPGVGALFERAVITTEQAGVENRGAAAVQRMYEDWTRIHDDGTLRTKHVTTNLIVEVADDEQMGTCRSYYTVFQQTDTMALQPIIAGRYHDTFEVTDGVWHFASRHMLTDLVGDLSEHLLQSLD